jgi:hypothetical protein
MARTTLTALKAQGAYGAYAANGADLAMSAADVSNMNQVVATGYDLIVAHNTGASTRTVTITSVADKYGRTGHITSYSLAAGEYAAFGPFELEGWKQSDGYLYFQADHAEVKFGIVAMNR